MLSSTEMIHLDAAAYIVVGHCPIGGPYTVSVTDGRRDAVDSYWA